MNDIDWVVIETTEGTFNPTQLHHKETVFTLSNGYLGTRGTFEEGYPRSCPATLISGVYDAAPVVVTELANCPDWASLTLQIGIQTGADAGIKWERFRLDQGEILNYKRWLNLRRGILSRLVQWRSPAGHVIELGFERFVSLAKQHVAAVRCQIRSINFAGVVEIHAGLNGFPDNEGLMHWQQVEQIGQDNTICLHLQSRQSQINLAIAAQLEISDTNCHTDTLAFHGHAAVIARFTLQPGQTVTADKIVAIFTSRDTENAVQAATQTLVALPDYLNLRAEHEAAWAEVWRISDVVIEGDSTAQLAVRYNLFQLLSAAPRHSDRVSIPAKALSGFAYRGHIFWDTEIFVLPFLIYTQPHLARNLLTYRYHMLPGARRKALQAGYEGAMYVWESADTGDEVTPNWVPDAHDPKSLVRIWCGEIELHISTDVAYAVWQYWQATGDDAWMCRYGAEIILDTAVFWGSRVEWNEAREYYEICDVIGPDEYHERVNNNAFTNAMVQWHLETALKLWDWLEIYYPQTAADLQRSLDLSESRLQHWATVIHRLWIPQDPDTGLIEQFEDFFALEDVNLAAYEPRLRSMQAILGIEGANRRQVLKQADVLMLLYLLRRGAFADRISVETPESALAEALRNRQILQTNWDYYNPRTDHTYGSSLSPAVHAVLACELGEPNLAYEHFMRSALVDLADVRGNAAEGIHAASAGGVWQAVVFGFGGVHLTANGPVAAPTLPNGWTRLAFNLMWKGQIYEFDWRSPVVVEPTSTSQLPPIQAVIFDLDGVITDTSEFHYQGWQRLADEVGIPFNREMNESLRGVSRRESLQRILNGRSVSAIQFQEMMDRKNRYYLELIRTITPDQLLPGVADLLTELRDAGIKIALGSSSKNAPEVLHRLGIVDYMDAIADGNSVTQSKPAPDVFLHAARQLGIAPEHCVVIEDAASGIEAAIRAGMWAVGLGSVERVKDAHVMFPSLAGVHWADLLDCLTQVTSLKSSSLTVQDLTQLQKASRAGGRVHPLPLSLPLSPS
ncbi:beta-phosphoglucomutase [Leptolyngbyaceae cyanobacterium JSC-12]|nr:beta-phosphoglucomutase [Leptolyngbyaceae cyanobacterium JSC-12]